MRVVPSNAYETFYQAAALELRRQHAIYHKPPYFISYNFKIKGQKDIDLDNAIASVNDLLEDLGIIHNDSKIIRLEAKKSLGHKESETIITITEFSN